MYFASKRLSKAERNYHTTDLEALALVFELKKFHFFIYGMSVVAKTDLSPITSLFRRTNVSARVLRWAMEIQQYRVTIEYVKGKANPVADVLSRGIPISQDDTQGTCEEDEKVVCSVNMRKKSEWLAALRSDPEYALVIEALEKGDVDKEIRLSGTSKALKVADFVVEVN
ncbi:unnamed protein product [Heligmosomoides polygyrus]|uniref:RT_RNaseH domain-containing protein n=1 Tax=Heligmosomoides polygyrus TaxID=6339 RepID=A0A183GTF7_HELPZ|nr:unnamed protein product [Heligmosomoides polygyrus]